MNELAIIIGINLKGLQDLDYELNELANLCEACNIEICDRCTQNIKEINKATYIGKGKINEIKELATYHNCDCIVCNEFPNGVEDWEFCNFMRNEQNSIYKELGIKKDDD